MYCAHNSVENIRNKHLQLKRPFVTLLRNFFQKHKTRGPMVLYRLPECVGYAELKQACKYMTLCCISFHTCIRKQILPCHGNGHDQPSVIIWINLVVLENLMLSTKFQGHRTLSSREGDFWRFLPYIGLEAILGHVTWNSWTNFHPNIPWRLLMKFAFKRLNSVF